MTRGAFSYLDDKGSQRSIQYIAGAGIGYRVVQDTVGPQSHLLPRPANVELGILYSRNRGVVPNDFANAQVPNNFPNTPVPNNFPNTPVPNSFPNTPVPNSFPNTPEPNNFPGTPAPNIFPTTPVPNTFPNAPDFEHREDDHAINGLDGHGGHNDNDGFADFDWKRIPLAGGGFNPSPTQEPGSYTIITNYGNKFFGIPPGASVRAHVQNIDLKQFGDFSLTPGEALRRDERRFHLRNSQYD